MVIELEYNLYFTDFRMLRELVFAPSEIGGDIRLTMCTDAKTPTYELIILATGISKFSLYELFGGPLIIQGFDVINIRDRGLENINWKIFDYEDDRIEILAKDIKIISLSPVVDA